VKMRADRGGHSAPEPVLRGIYESSISNLLRAIREMDLIYVYENGEWGKTPVLLLQAEHGRLCTGLSASHNGLPEVWRGSDAFAGPKQFFLLAFLIR